MKNENAEKPAMPSTVESKDRVLVYLGLTKREYFSAMAMQGLLAQNGYSRMDILASDAVEQADAILEELEK